MNRILLFVPAICVGLLAIACGGTPASEPPAPVAEDTSGGEVETPVALRTTVPVPVPMPAIPREQLSAPVQTIWTRTEEIVVVRAPEPPVDATEEAIAAWTEDPFLPWLRARQAAVQEIEPLVEQIGDDGVQRAVAGVLFPYVYEDSAAGIRGAPVPEAIAADAELLEIYARTVDEALRPFAQRALESYAYCATTFARIGDDAWAEWAVYCLERGREVAEVFRLGETEPPPAETEARPAE